MTIRGFLCLIVSGALLVGCREDTAAPQTDSAPPTIWLSGCAATGPGDLCLISPVHDEPGGLPLLHLWLSGPAERASPPLSIELHDGERLQTAACAPQSSPDGFSCRFEVPAGVDSLIVRDAALGEVLLARRIQADVPCKTDLDASQVASHVPPQSPSLPRCRVRHESRAARQLARTEQLDEAIGRLWRNVATAAFHGFRTEAVSDGTALAYHLVHRRGAYSQAQWLLAALAVLAIPDAEGTTRVAYHTGLLSLAMGDYRATLHHLQRAARDAARLRVQALQVHAGQVLAETYSHLGRADAAQRWLDRAQSGAQSMGACEEARFHTNVGWSAWLRREVSPLSMPDPLPHFERALALHQTACPNGRLRANAHVNLALTALQRGDGDPLAHLVAARAEGPLEGALADWATYAEAWQRRVAGAPLAAGELSTQWLDAHRHAAELEGGGATAEDLAYRMACEQARAWRDAGDSERALDAFARAHDSLRAGSVRVPLGEGRAGFLGLGARGASEWIELLVATNQVETAIEVAYSLASAVLDDVSARARLAALPDGRRAAWQDHHDGYLRSRGRLRQRRAALAEAPLDRVAALREEIDELEADSERQFDAAMQALRGDAPAAVRRSTALTVPDGVVELTLISTATAEHPHAMVVLARSAERHRARRLAALTADAVWALVAEMANEVHELHVLSLGDAERVDVHALAFRDGSPLLQRVAVTHIVPAQALGPASEGGDGHPQIWVWGDAEDNLPHAREEAIAVRDQTQSDSVAVHVLLGSEVSYRDAAQALERAALLHIAGHAAVQDRDGVFASVPLAGDADLSASDIVSRNRVPPRIVLSACYGAGPASAPGPSGVGMARAFILAGAEQVVASPREVSDQCSALWARAFYSRGAPLDRTKFGRAYRRASLEVRANAPECDWAAFRLVTRQQIQGAEVK